MFGSLLASDCNCGKDQAQTTDTTEGLAVYNHNECKGITADLLRMFLRPIECCLEHQLWNNVESTQAELESAKTYLLTYIAAKDTDPDTCQYKENLPIVQGIVNKIVYYQICI